MKKLNKYIKSYSPNYSDRKCQIKYIINHYTGMKNLKDTLALFKSPYSKVSCHWLVSENGVLYKIVEEDKIAWHAGVSNWKKDKNLNDTSIGIELQNRGHGKYYKPYKNSQLLVFESLIKN